MVSAVLSPPLSHHSGPLKCVDLDCGSGDFHTAALNLGFDVVFSYDRTDESASYGDNEIFGHGIPRADRIPEHDLLLAVMPGQPVSENANGNSLLTQAMRIVRVKASSRSSLYSSQATGCL